MDGLDEETAGRLRIVSDIAERFHLTSVLPVLRVCESLSVASAPLDIAVLGQFKSGKSSLLNAVVGENIFPVGALPLTAVITRVSAAADRSARVTRSDGSVEKVEPERIADYVTESGNPANRRRVAAVDVLTPALQLWPGVRLVDTPGLGSVFAHNTEATRKWLPNVAVALVTVSCERPLSEEDRQLVAEARRTAPRVFIVLTKVDLLTESERAEVLDFVERALIDRFGASMPVLQFSTRSDTSRWLLRLQESVLRPLEGNIAGERRAALRLKLSGLVDTCRGYLAVGLAAAERADGDRDRLRAAVLDESVNAAVLRDELRLAEQSVRAGRARPSKRFCSPAALKRNDGFLCSCLPTSRSGGETWPCRPAATKAG